MNSVGARIKIIRCKFKMKQIEFANTLGISQGTLSDIERDRYNPSITTVLSIMNNFNICSNWVLSGKCLHTDFNNKCPHYNKLVQLDIIKFQS